MRHGKRYIRTWFLLAVYLSVTLFGELVHMAQCASVEAGTESGFGCSTCCCRVHSRRFGRRTAPSSEAPLRAHSGGTPSESNQHGDEPRPDHEGSSCAICQALAVVADSGLFTVSLQYSGQIHQVLIRFQESAVASEVPCMQSRGPPLI